MDKQLLDMGFSIVSKHESGSLYCNSNKTIFVTLHENEILLYYSHKNKKAYRYKKYAKDDLSGITKLMQGGVL